MYVAKDGKLFLDKWFTVSNSVVDSATGNFAADVVGHVGGTYQWWVRGWSPDGLGAWSDSLTFALGLPGPVSLLAPADGATLTNLFAQLTWSQSAPPAAWFRLAITRNGSSYLDQWLQGTTNWTSPTALPSGAYTWRVQTYNSAGLGAWSTNATFTVPVCVPSTVVLVSPSGVAAANSIQRYTWKTNACAVWYELYVTRNGALLADKWFTASNSVADSATGDFAVDVRGHVGGTYLWYVRGWSPDGLGPWSGPNAFIMPNLMPPGAVTLLTPTNGATVPGQQPQLTWSQSTPSADWFRVYVTRNGNPYVDQWIEGATNWTASAGLPAGNYAWAVQTFNAAGFGLWSVGSSFKVLIAVPSRPVLLSPTGSVAANAIQRYTWKDDPAALWYELYVVRNGALFADQWLALSNSVAIGGTNFAVDVGGHISGTYQWWVRGWSPDGLGLWSSSVVFQTP